LRIAFLVERPTQFEAPFFRYAARDREHELRVLFTSADPTGPIFDPELGQSVSWGIDLLGGYPSVVAPARGRARWLAQQLQRGSCDLLIVNGYTRGEYLLAAIWARRVGIATALRLDSVAWDKPAALQDRLWARRILFSALLRPLFSRFLGVGSLTLDYLAACGVPAERCGLFPYAVDVDGFRARSSLNAGDRAEARARLGIAPSQRAVLAVAKLNAREAPWDLLNAVPDLPAETCILIAGDGPDRAGMEKLAADFGPGRVRFLGYIPYTELPVLYGAVDLFVHAPREERWGVSVSEALACGLPVVASTRVGAAYDLLAAGANGGMYSAGDAAQLAARAGQAMALDRQVVEAANRKVLRSWNYEASWRYLLDAAAQVVGGFVR
jgi:glycosyltransferase involved in cell wall biosynthesis